MDSAIKKVFSHPPAEFTFKEEEHIDGNWSSKISFPNEDQFPHLAFKGEVKDVKEIFASQIAERKVSRQVQLETAKGIQNSTASRPDIRMETHFPTLSDKPYISHYRMVHNGHVPGAITSSLDRITPKLTLARQMTAKDAKGKEYPILYAGRPDTWDKCLELAGMVFQGELRCGKNLPKKDGVYQLKFGVNSSLNLIPGSHEYALARKECHILRQFDGQTVSLQKPDGTWCKVKCGVVFFARQFNFCNSLEKTLPPSQSGEGNADLFSADIVQLKSFLEEKAKKPEVASLLETLKSEKQLTAEEALFCRLLLFKKADIPIVVHCKSCVDRTGIVVAMAYALDQWEKSDKALPEIPHQLLKDETFKELFFAHIQPAHFMTFYSRGGKTDQDGYGLKWHAKLLGMPLYFTQHPGALALIPERFKKTYLMSMGQMALIPGGTILGARNILNNFSTWITAKDQMGKKTRIITAIFRAIFFIPLAVKGLVETLLLTLFNPNLKYLKTLYYLSPEKIIPESVSLNNRPFLFA